MKEVLKQNPSASLGKNESIQITRSGGLVKLDGYVFRVENTAIQQLKKDKDYLLFLNYIPEANGYTADNSFGDFILEDNRFVSLSKAPLPKKIRTDNDSQTITNDIRGSVERGCDLDSNEGRSFYFSRRENLLIFNISKSILFLSNSQSFVLE